MLLLCATFITGLFLELVSDKSSDYASNFCYSLITGEWYLYFELN